jgi:hypothetical protein
VCSISLLYLAALFALAASSHLASGLYFIMPPQQDQEYDSDVPDIEPSYSKSNSESESAFDSDEELMQVCTALVPIPDNAMTGELHQVNMTNNRYSLTTRIIDLQVLEVSQKLLLNLCG